MKIIALLLAMASELHPLRSELQIWLSRGTSSLEIQNENFAVGYPIGTQNRDIQMWTFLIWGCCCF